MEKNLNQDRNGFEAGSPPQVRKELFNELVDKLCAVKKPESTNSESLESKPPVRKGFSVYASTGEYVEIKDAVLVSFDIEPDFYVHRPLKGDGYVVSEAETGLRIEVGATAEIATNRAWSKIKGFIDKNGKEAFLKLLSDAKAKLAETSPVYETVPEKQVNPEVKVPDSPKPEIVQQSIESTASTVPEAITMSLNFKNSIDVEYISDILGKTEQEIEEELKMQKLAFLNPETGFFESPDEYLSGNVRIKLKIAEEACISDPRYEVNVERLKEVIPENIPAALIQYELGAAWIPIKVFEQFATGMFKTKISISYMSTTGKYSIKSVVKTIQITSTYAAGGKNGLDILNATLNNQQITISEMVDNGSGKKSVKSMDKTAAAQSMQEQMQDEFQAFIRVNKNIEEETEKIYNEQFNSYVHRDFRTPELTHYPGASQHFFLRQHQKKAVLRGLNGSTLFAHAVGSGKTALQITTAMEMKRLGIAEKPMIVVQNKTYGQFISEFMEIYPNANLLAPTELQFSSGYKGDLHHMIRDQDWDCIIIPHSQFDMITDDISRQKKLLWDQLAEAEDIMYRTDKRVMPFEWAQANRASKMIKKELDQLELEEEKKKQIRVQAGNLFGTKPQLNFEDLNVDALLIDEFHRYKRLGFATQMANIKGIDTAKSKRSQSVLLKMRWIQEQKGGKNTLVYTGTPISNTMAEAWTMIRYVRPDILKEIGIEHFDQFAKTFGKVVPSLEQTGGGTFKIQNRFAKFQNLPEFITAFRTCTDVVLREDIPEFWDNNTIPKLKGGQITQVIIKQSPELKLQIAEFRRKLEWFDELEGAEKRQYSYIPMVIFGRAKQASIDLRLLNPNNRDNPMSKVNQVIRKAYQTYVDTGLCQMIFSDLYQSPEPKAEFLDEDNTIPNPAFGIPRFNLFNDIKYKLVSMGVHPEEIAILTESKYDNPDKAQQLFAAANSGKIKFMLGSTERMGVGVNAQKKLYALHHIDAPPRPMDFEQRNGRIQRQGNDNDEIEINAYGTEKTLDSAAFQRLATKQRFINQIMKGEGVDRIVDDAADESQMTFDEMMAHLSDSPYAMQKLLVDNRLKSEILKRDNHYAKQVQTNRQLNYAMEDVTHLKLEYEQELKYGEVVVHHFGEEGKITEMDISGVIHTESFTAAASEYIEMLLDRYRESPTFGAKGHFFINQVKVELTIVNTQRTSAKTKIPYDYPMLTYIIPEIGIFVNRHGNGIHIESNSGTGLMNSIRWKIEDAVQMPAITKRKISSHMIAIEELEKNLNNPYDESKIESLQQEIETLKNKMLEESSKPVEEDILTVVE